MQLYPVFLNLKERPCLVVGGGAVAERKVLALLEVQAKVTVISPEITEKLSGLHETETITLKKRPYAAGDAEGFRLVFAATNDHLLNREIAKDCAAAGAFLNAVDDPENCDFYVPALCRKGDVAVAVSSAGASPVLAGRVRDEIAENLPEALAVLAEVFRENREKIRELPLSYAEKKALYARIVDECLHLKQEESREKAEACISSYLDSIIRPPR